MATTSITSNNFNLVLESEKPVLLDFYADWCGPCRMVAPIVEAISEEHPEVFVGKVNVEQEQALAIKHNVENIPTLLLFKDGKEINRLIGLHSKQEIINILQA